jgi:hypothetical protein
MVNLVTSFKDDSHLYMLMECVMGGELFTYLQSRPGPLKEDHARFYAASVVLGLEYMQERSLLWRWVAAAFRLHACCPCHAQYRDAHLRLDFTGVCEHSRKSPQTAC